jgi:hypothetical protein
MPVRRMSGLFEFQGELVGVGRNGRPASIARPACLPLRRRIFGTISGCSSRWTEDIVLWLLVVVSILIGGYYVSLKLNPWVKCSKCHGQPRIKGSVFSHAHHTCPKCEGSGQQVRWGNSMLRKPNKPR